MCCKRISICKYKINVYIYMIKFYIWEYFSNINIKENENL